VVDGRRPGRADQPARAASAQDEAAELPDEDVLPVLPDVLLVLDVAEDDAGFVAGAVEDFPPERESVR
jgi:hypothetical protein